MIYETKEASSSECSECKRENMVHADQSSSEEEELVVPLRKAPKPKKTHPPPPHLEALHAEIAFLRRQNMQKDSLIADMKYHTRLIPEEELERLRRQMSNPTRLVMAAPPPHGARTYPIPPRQEVSEPTATGDVTVLTLEKQVREQQIQLMTLKQKLATVEAESDWLVRFAQTFVRMNQDLSKVYGERLHLKAMPLKRKTKLAWRYMKDLINTLIKE